MYKPEIRDNIQLKKIFFPSFRLRKIYKTFSVLMYIVHSTLYISYNF